MGIGRVLIISSDSILKNSLGLMVSCHNFRQVAIVWLLGLVGCGGCWIGGLLQPFGQRRLRSFLASFHQQPYSRAYSILNSIRRHFFKCLWVVSSVSGFASEIRGLLK